LLNACKKQRDISWSNVMLKWIFSLVLAAVLSVLSVGMAQAMVLKIATVAPEGSQWMQEMRKGAEQIKERTGGRVVIKFYAGGVMGNEKSVLRKIRIGQLHGGAFTGGGLAEVYPDINLYSLPLVFHSPEEVDYVRARMDKILLDGLERAGFVSFGFAEAGFAQLMANMPVRAIEEIKGKKVWVPEGDRVNYAVMESVGLAPVTLPITDVLTGLQTGLIDIVGVSPIGAIAFQWHTKVRYVTKMPLVYLFATLVVDRRVFGGLDPEDQSVVHEVMGRIYADFDRQSRRDNEAASQALVEQGLTFVDPLHNEADRLRSIAHSTILGLGQEGVYTPALFDRLQVYLKEFRTRGRGERMR
jgi:TRAP-type C4-dicarboxylate transport system substrate-binding protein